MLRVICWLGVSWLSLDHAKRSRRSITSWSDGVHGHMICSVPCCAALLCSLDAADGGEAGAEAAGSKGSSRHRSSRSSRLARQQQEQEEKHRKAQQLSVVLDDDSVPDWAEERAEQLHHRHKQGSNQGPDEQQPLLQGQQNSSTEVAPAKGSGTEGLFSKYGVDLASLAEKYNVSLSALEDVLHNPKKAAVAAEEKLKAAAHEAEERLKGIRPGGCVGR